MSKGTVVLLVVLGCILLAVANVALWTATSVFDPERFGRHVAAGLQSDEASEALAGAMVNRIVEQYPEFPPLAQLPAEEVITWLLQRPAFTTVLKEIAATANVVMTTSAQDVIGIDLSHVAPQVIGVVTAVAPEVGSRVQEAIASAQASGRLVIYESGRFPRLRWLANTVPWLWPLAGLGAIALLAVAYLRAKDRRRTLVNIGIGILITGILALLLIPALEAPVLNNVTNPAMRVVVDSVLGSLTQGLAIQSLILGLIGAFLIVAGPYLYKRARVPGEYGVSDQVTK